nr:MAG TPA: hypothetical protein [Microviridae sp.]
MHILFFFNLGVRAGYPLKQIGFADTRSYP